jgi:hypothetical protein
MEMTMKCSNCRCQDNGPCVACKKTIAEGDYISLAGECSACNQKSAQASKSVVGDEFPHGAWFSKAPNDKEAAMRRLSSEAASTEVSEATEVVNSMAGYLDTGMSYVAAFEKVLAENDALKARVVALEEVVRFYLKEDDGGSKAGRVLGLW